MLNTGAEYSVVVNGDYRQVKEFINRRYMGEYLLQIALTGVDFKADIYRRGRLITTIWGRYPAQTFEDAAEGDVDAD